MKVIIDRDYDEMSRSAYQHLLSAWKQRIEAEGKFLLPGFIDTHAHVTLGPVQMDVSSGVPAMSVTADPEVPLRTLRTLLAHGVTSIRDPGGA